MATTDGTIVVETIMSYQKEQDLLTERFKEVLHKFKNKEIEGFVNEDGTKYRLFLSNNDVLCFYAKGKKRWGYQVELHHLRNFKGCYPDHNKKVDPDKKIYNQVAKYRKYAIEATFTNEWIEDCLKIPATYDDWFLEGKKSLYELRITTGNKIDGVVITLASIEKEYEDAVRRFRIALMNREPFRYGRVRFRNYDMTMSIEIDGNGNPKGFLSMEYKDCGNGYYYMLINDDNFIGYDVD